MNIRFGDLIFDGELRRLTRGGQDVHLSPKAFQLLATLIEARPRPVAKAALIDLLWPDVVVEEANVRNLIAEIREAIGDQGKEGSGRGSVMIRTIPRFGYAFEAEAGDSEAEEVPRLIGLHRDYPLRGEENVIGRDGDCAVTLPDPLVSRRHALVRLTAGQATIEDLGSRNGTLVNGVRIAARTELSDGDTIEVGPVRMTFRILDRNRETEPMVR
ncbi:MAG TPA: FHA domain-containing protein [Thermoanaerobaculia bacterium]|nr:FHA domain-containing protein [Thermoanaerobaculia bacterium]